jgi:hypothetical protein
MTIGLFMDVHIDAAITAQLRRRQVDVLTAQDDGATTLRDDLLLERASQLGRPLVTHDIRLKAMAEDWQQQARAFCGVIFGHAMQVSVGRMVTDLDLIAKATDPQDWVSVVVRLPL